MKTGICGLIILALACLSSDTVQAQPEPGAVVAVVGDESIYQSQVEWEYNKKFGEREIDEPLASQLQQAILTRLINQHLVLSKLTGTPLAATDDEVNLEISRIGERLKQIDKTLEQFLAENHQSLEGLQFNVRWQIGWQRYLDRTINDDVLAMFFDRNRPRLDGTRLWVAHLLLKLADNPQAEDVDEIQQQAEQIRQRINQGQLTWEDATRQYSTAPSADNGGEMGWINFDGPMPREFTEAAFRLKTDEVSEPVQTSFGVHLIKCLKIEPGEKNWYDDPEKVRLAATEFLFERISSQQRDKVEVRLMETTNDAGDGNDR